MAKTKKLAGVPEKKIATVPEPTPAEAEAIAAAREAVSERRPRVTSGVVTAEGGALRMASPHTDAVGWEARLKNAFGTRSWAFTEANICAIANVIRWKDGTIDARDVDAILAAIDGAKPKTEMEAMLATQLAVTHILVMRSARLMAASTGVEQQDSNGLALYRLNKTFVDQIEALAKVQRGGEQKVVVEHKHVYVYPGGQAVVGNVSQAPGGGVYFPEGNQPHAADQNDPRTLAIAHSGAVWCQDPKGDALPVSRGPQQAAMPDAWRRAGIGRPKGGKKR